MSTSSTNFGERLILSNAPLIATAPNLGAGIPAKEPRKLPMGVRATDTITTSFISTLSLYYEINKI
jgi:hypothetical protein